MKIKILIWLMIQNKILTQQVLISRGCQVQTGCHLCQATVVETRDHMFWQCPYATRFWRGLCAHFNFTFLGSSVSTIPGMWNLGRRHRSARGKTLWDAMWAAGAWALWKEQNRRLFTNKQRLVHHVIDTAITDTLHWLNDR